MLEAGSTRLARKMDTYIHYLKYGGVAEDAREARYQRTHACAYMYVFADHRVLIRLVAAATIRERRLFRSALAQVRLLFESGVYSVGACLSRIDNNGHLCGIFQFTAVIRNHVDP